VLEALGREVALHEPLLPLALLEEQPSVVLPHQSQHRRVGEAQHDGDYAPRTHGQTGRIHPMILPEAGGVEARLER
jgi:hypothetical protein